MTPTKTATPQPTSSTNSEAVTTLAEQIRGDGDEQSRDCPHNCPGTLSVTDDEIVLCQVCRTTPDGDYIPAPEKPEKDGLSEREGWGKRSENGVPKSHIYSYSEKVKMAGGFEDVYDEDDGIRPDGVTDDYTFDLSTL